MLEEVEGEDVDEAKRNYKLQAGCLINSLIKLKSRSQSKKIYSMSSWRLYLLTKWSWCSRLPPVKK